MEDFKAQFEASQTELANIKSILEQYQANKQALETTTQDLLAANINLKASELLSAGVIARLKAEVATLKAEAEKTAAVVSPDAELTDAA